MATKREPLTEQDIERMEQAVSDVGFGNNTQDLPRRYARDVRRLLDDREAMMLELTKLRSALSEVANKAVISEPMA